MLATICRRHLGQRQQHPQGQRPSDPRRLAGWQMRRRCPFGCVRATMLQGALRALAPGRKWLGRKWIAVPLRRAGGRTIVEAMPHDTSLAPTIRAEEHDSYRVLAGRADARLILLCDHAGNALPPTYGSLGLPPEQLARHIAYDIGAAEVTRRLAGALGVPAVMTRYSRLLIDPNRGADDPTLIMRLSDGAVIPGNCHLDGAEREKRIRLYYAPYHRAIDAVLDRYLASGVAPCILSVHSFTESWKTLPRPWHVGVLWDRDDRLAK